LDIMITLDKKTKKEKKYEKDKNLRSSL
jgi:hypothetical protein